MSLLDIIYNTILVLCFVYSAFLSVKFGFKKTNYLFFYFFVTIVTEFSVYLAKEIYKIYLDWIYNYFCLFFILFFAFYYIRIVPKKFKQFIIILTSVFTLIFLFNFDFKLTSFQTVLGLITSFYIIILCIYWFYVKLNSITLEPILSDPTFWITSGLLISSIFFVFRITPRYLFDEIDKSFLLLIHSIYLFVVIIEYSLFFVSLLTLQRSLHLKQN